ncbi:MAG: 3-hydroxyacyl-CoA dehydrogenase family protein [Desulfarculus sp.]|jgi:3-hydroxybutyryl-CoA dehydrogenase|nr:MAG: 3-hydroxyacyl-CoA dehydrogenase family protein [Desulfarculus sp.]
MSEQQNKSAGGEKLVLVLGAGFMGAGIAQVCAQAGYRVHLYDVKPEALERALKGMAASLGKLAAKGRLSETPAQVLARVQTVAGLESAAQACWVIEAALEIESLKKELFAELDRLAPASTPLASNTSSIPISRLAAATQHPERVLGTHFFGPVPLMGLVEVIKADKTSDEVFERGVAFVRSLGKTPVRVRRDIPCFVMNRIFSAAFREAADLVAAGVVSPEDVDVGMKLGYGWNAGPFEIADNAGLDTWVLIAESMRALGEENLVSQSDLIPNMVAQGRLGRKVGKGFYRYTPEGKRLSWDEQA